MIIFLYGEDAFRSQKKLNELRDKFLEKNESGFRAIDFSENPNLEFSKIKETLGSKGLFSSKQLVIFKNFFSSKSADQMLEFLKSARNIFEDKDLVLVFFESGKIRKGNKLFEFLEKNSKKQKFELLEGAKLSRWIEDEIGKINSKVSISKKALERLISFVGSDLLVLNNEIEKLAAFKNEGEIEEEDVDNLVRAKINSNIFETIEAFSSGNKKKALALYHQQLQDGQDPFYILSMYAYQIRNLLKIEDVFSNETRNQYEIAKSAKLHPFVVQKGIEQIKFLGAKKLKNIFSKLQEIDFLAKTGKTDIKLALDKFIVEA
jgi:DNA polymerase III subunit delta